jgi:NAD-dependent DNA ligase
MGAKGISDGVMSSVVDLTHVNEFSQLFCLQRGDLSRHDGWGSQSESDFLNEIDRIKDTPHPYSLFLGALGIPMVSVEKCRILMQNTTFVKLMEAARKDSDTCYEMIMSVDGFGHILAKNIIEYLQSNYHEIMDTANQMNLYQDQISHSKGTVVFSGFRDEELREKIEELGFKYSENVTKETVAVISATSSSGKAKKAIAKGIPLYASYEDKELLSDLRKI